MSDPNCIFCKIVSKEVTSDKIFFEDDDVMVIPDKFPKADIHILFLSKKHIQSIAHAQEADRDLIGKILLLAADQARKQGIADYQLVFNAGKHTAVPHLHLHLISGNHSTPLPE